MSKFLQKISPLLILMIFSIILASYYIFRIESVGENWDQLISLILIGVAILFFIIDLLLKKFIKNRKKLFLIQIGIILLLIGYDLYTK